MPRKRASLEGEGVTLTKTERKKESLINEFVAKILAQFHQNRNTKIYFLYK
jgi:hypothetical protein